MEVVGSCGGTDSGTKASAPSFPVFPLSLYLMNECCMRRLRPAFCWKWTYQSVLRATTTTTTTPTTTIPFSPSLWMLWMKSAWKASGLLWVEMDLTVSPESSSSSYYYYYYHLLILLLLLLTWETHGKGQCTWHPRWCSQMDQELVNWEPPKSLHQPNPQWLDTSHVRYTTK